MIEEERQELRKDVIAKAKRVVLECWYRGGVHSTLDSIDCALDRIADTGEFPSYLEKETREAKKE